MQKRWVIADTHGCAKTLKALVDAIGPSHGDALFFLGDYIDRGPDSKGVLDFIQSFSAFGVQGIPLLGNHEEVLLELRKEQRKWPFRLFSRRKKLQEDWIYFGGEATLASFGVSVVNDIPANYWEWMEALPHYREEPDYYLVHAGFNFSRKDFLSDRKAMLWIRKMKPPLEITQQRPIIHGHVPTHLYRIEAMINNPESPILPLDNGCVYKYTPSLGNLLALELSTRKLIIQPNIDF